jgi:hypothetical protein
MFEALSMSDLPSRFRPRARILVYGNCGNIGDAVQTVAMSRLLGGVCAGIWRDAPMPSLHGDVPFIVNGWLGKGTPLPDSNCLFAGIHLGLREPDYIGWIRRSRFPVGVRDEFTRGLLGANGIPSELIGCATLTLPRYHGPRHGKLSVDVEQVPGTRFETSIIPDMPWADQWALALHRLEELRQAELVYTRRLHVVLPCLAFGTPVVFPLREFRDLSDKSRLGLLHTLGFKYDQPVQMDVSPVAERFIRFLSESLGEPIAPVDLPEMPVPIMPPATDAEAQLEESLDAKVMAQAAGGSATVVCSPAPSVSALVFTKNGASRLPACLESIRRTNFVQDIVVCVDADSADESVAIARSYTPHVHIAPAGFPEVGRKLARGVSLCPGDFVLRVDDDETLGGNWDRESFELLVRFNDLTHFWTPTRWMVPQGDQFIASPPWSPDLHVRVFLKNPRVLSFPAQVHEHLRVSGRSLVLYDRWIDHHNLAQSSREEREAKCRRYASLRPDHHMSDYYLFEGKDLQLMPANQPAHMAANNLGAGARGFHARVPYTPGTDVDFRTGGNAGDYTLGGWSEPEPWGTWTIDEEADVWLPLDEPVGPNAKLVAVVQAFVRPGRPVSRTQVLYAGKLIDEWVFDSSAQSEKQCVLPAVRIASDRTPTFTFRSLNPVSPLELKESTDPRALGLGFTTLRLVAG